MSSFVAHMGKQGRIVVPAAMRRALDLEAGDEVMMRIVDGALVVEPIAKAVAEVQAAIRSYGGTGRDLTDELISERRAEVEDA